MLWRRLLLRGCGSIVRLCGTPFFLLLHRAATAALLRSREASCDPRIRLQVGRRPRASLVCGLTLRAPLLSRARRLAVGGHPPPCLHPLSCAFRLEGHRRLPPRRRPPPCIHPSLPTAEDPLRMSRFDSQVHIRGRELPIPSKRLSTSKLLKGPGQ